MTFGLVHGDPLMKLVEKWPHDKSTSNGIGKKPWVHDPDRCRRCQIETTLKDDRAKSNSNIEEG